MASGAKGGRITFSLHLETTALARQVGAVERTFTGLTTVVSRTQTRMSRIDRTFSTFKKTTDQIVKCLRVAAASLRVFSRAASKTTSAVQTLTRRGVKRLTTASDRMGESLRRAASRGLLTLRRNARKGVPEINAAAGALKGVGTAAGGASKPVAGFGGKVLGSLKAGLPGLVVGLGVSLVKAIGRGAVALVELGSRAEQTGRQLEIAFGGVAGDVAKNIDTLAATTGKSRFELQNLAVEAGRLVGQFGVGSVKAGEMSTELVRMAADIAAVKNIGMDEAMDMLADAFDGGSDSLRSLGVDIDEAAIKQQAMKMGLAETADAVSEQDAAHATMALLLQQTAQFSGQAEDRLSTFAGQMGRLKAVVLDAASQLGKVFMPILTEMVKFVTDTIIPLIEDWKAKWAEVGPTIVETVTAIALHIEERFAVQWAILSAVFGAISDGFSAVWSLVGPIIEKMFGTLNQRGVSAADTVIFAFKNWRLILEAQFLSVAAKIVEVVNVIKHHFTKTLPATLKWLLGVAMDFGKSVINFVSSTIRNIVGNIISMPSKIFELLRGKRSLTDMWEPMTDGFKFQVRKFPDIAAREVEGLEEILKVDRDAAVNKLAENHEKIGEERRNRRSAIRNTLAATLGGKGRELGEGLDIKPPEPEKPAGSGGGEEGGKEGNTSGQQQNQQGDGIPTPDRDDAQNAFKGIADVWKNINTRGAANGSNGDNAKAAANNTRKMTTDTSKMTAKACETVMVLREIRDLLTGLNIGLAE